MKRKNSNENIRLWIYLAPFIFLILLMEIGFFPAKQETSISAQSTRRVVLTTETALTSAEPTTDPFKYAYDVPMNRQLKQYTVNTAEKYDLDPALVFAVMEIESNFDFLAKSADGTCFGIMQIHSCNYEDLRRQIGTNNLMVPEENIEAGCYILSRLTQKYPLERALVCYNCGEYGSDANSTEYSRTVLRAMEKYQK